MYDGRMNDTLAAAECARQRLAVGHVTADPLRRPGARGRFRTAERPDLCPPARQSVDDVRADEPARAREEDVHLG
jgi:hypothetical protein